MTKDGDRKGSIEVGGLTWGFLHDPPPIMHLATTNRRHIVWLEDAGGRIFRPQFPEPPAQALEGLRLWLADHQSLVERAWITEVMIPMDWLQASVVPDCEGDIIVEAYADTLKWFSVVVLGEYIGRLVWGDDDIAIDNDTAELIIGLGHPRGEQQREDLTELLFGLDP